MVSIVPLQPHDSEIDATRTRSGGPSGVRESFAGAGADKQPSAQSRIPHSSSIKHIPDDEEVRERVRQAAEDYVIPLERRHHFAKRELIHHGRQLLGQLSLSERYLGFAMVLVANAFWKQSFLSIPYSRRLLLMPGRATNGHAPPTRMEAKAESPELIGDLASQQSKLIQQLAKYKAQAEKLGYQVVEADHSPSIMNILVEGSVDAILGIAGLNDLEKSVDQVILAGVPSYAIPMRKDEHGHFSIDDSWVSNVLAEYQPAPSNGTVSYLPLIRAANTLFTTDFAELLPRYRSQSTTQAQSPIGRTEDVAYDWLMHGGKRFRPFITLATYDALTGGDGSLVSTAGSPLKFSSAVCRGAMAIEAFHKASLVHDDIQDDDLYRYGRETLHRTHGVGMAINVGDYLIGLGYQLVNSTREELGSAVACDILDKMALAHIRLCDGQGAEMAWQTAPSANFTPGEALQIYALKTAPAFEAALYAGVRMAGPADDYEEIISPYCRHLGIGFQILNDLKDWTGDNNNKLVSGQDAKALRPTLLLALALKKADVDQRAELQALIEGSANEAQDRLDRFRQIFIACDVFEQAREMVEDCRRQATALSEEVKSLEFRDLLLFLVDTVLAEEPSGN